MNMSAEQVDGIIKAVLIAVNVCFYTFMLGYISYVIYLMFKGGKK